MIKCILVSAGHGRSYPLNLKDPGACAAGYTERSFNIQIARELMAILKTKKELKDCIIQGVGVETEANIRNKIFFANKVIKENKLSPNECLYIALHVNSTFGTQANGFEVWYGSKKNSSVLAEQIVRANIRYKLFGSRGTKAATGARAGYINRALCPAVLIENGFIGNVNDRKQLIENTHRVAEMNANGIMEYIRSII